MDLIVLIGGDGDEAVDDSDGEDDLSHSFPSPHGCDGGGCGGWQAFQLVSDGARRSKSRDIVGDGGGGEYGLLSSVVKHPDTDTDTDTLPMN